MAERKCKFRVPSLTHHKASGRARVRIDGRDIYCGAWDDDGPTAEAQVVYRRIVAEWLESGERPETRQDRAEGGSPRSTSINELILGYCRHAETYYQKNGRPTSEYRMIVDALRILKDLYGMLPVESFGPKKLKTVRDEMLRKGWTRGQINKQIGRIKRCFRWGVENEIVPGQVFHDLQAVAGLRKGRCDAREPAPVLPVDEHVVNATLRHLSPVVADMVRLQLLTGCRPGEVCSMRPCDVSREGDVWEYVPESHKTEHHGRARRIFIGPRAKSILLRYLDNRPADAFCFSPKESVAHFRQERRQDRKTKVQPSQQKRAARKSARPAKQPGDCYTAMAYGKAIKAACDKAMPRVLRNLKELPAEHRDRGRQLRDRWRENHVWSPNQLRHARATNLRRDYGVESAQVVLGHSDCLLTASVYAERDFDKARAVMAEVG